MSKSKLMSEEEYGAALASATGGWEYGDFGLLADFRASRQLLAEKDAEIERLEAQVDALMERIGNMT